MGVEEEIFSLERIFFAAFDLERIVTEAPRGLKFPGSSSQFFGPRRASGHHRYPTRVSRFVIVRTFQLGRAPADHQTSDVEVRRAPRQGSSGPVVLALPAQASKAASLVG